ncbi:MAG: GNAT family N-acetyltransferase [Verrucomicrobiales bacterium]
MSSPGGESADLRFSRPAAVIQKLDPVPGIFNAEAVTWNTEDAWLVIGDGQEARLALWWNQVPRHEGRPIGVIGAETWTSVEQGVALLQEAERVLVSEGCSFLVGPMAGNTWRSYRQVTEGWENGKPFLLEPWNQPSACEAWQSCGWRVLDEFYSLQFRMADLTDRSFALARVRTRLSEQGIVLRRFRTEAWDPELQAIYELSCRSFANAYLITDLAWAEFAAGMEKVRSLVDPECLLLAEKEGVLVGFVFGWLEPEDKRFIVKTLAIDPGPTFAGLGALLLDEIHQVAKLREVETVIHALMHQNNISLRLSRRSGGQFFRRYALWHKHLRD